MKNNISRMIALLLVLCMSTALLAACGQEAPAEVPATTAAAATEAATEAAETAEAAQVQDTMVGNTLVPTQEEALAQMGLDKVPEKILCATYNTMILANDLGVELSGRVTTRRPLPDNLKDVPDIGVVRGSSNFDFEKVIALSGDLVLSDVFYTEKLKPTLDEQGIKSYYVDTADYTAMRETVALLGAAFGKRDQAIAILTQWDEEVSAMQQAIAGKESPVVLVLRKATNMATKNSYVGSLFKELNITSATDLMGFEDDVAGYVPIDVEKILEVNPDYILIPGGEELEGDIAFMEEVTTSPAWATLDAVKEGRVFAVTDTYYQPIADMDCINAMHELFGIVYAD